MPAPSDPSATKSSPAGAEATSRSGQTKPRSALSLAAIASVAVPGLNPTRLTQPQSSTKELRVVTVVDTAGRTWEVLEPRDDATGAALEAEAGVLRSIGQAVDDGLVSFQVPRVAGALRVGGVAVQVRTHLPGSAVSLASLRPGPGLSSGLGRALGELHELPTSVIQDCGMPVYSAEEVRSRWGSLLDEADKTGQVPAQLMTRWRQALRHTALWRFRPVVVHGDLAEENVLVAGGGVVGLRGLAQAHVGDPAEDLAWVYASVPLDSLDSIENGYDLARSEGVDKHLRDRAELVSELGLVRWLLHGVRSKDDSVVKDAVAMLEDLLAQVGNEPLVEEIEPRLAPVPPRATSSPEAGTLEGALAEAAGSAQVAAHVQEMADATEQLRLVAPSSQPVAGRWGDALPEADTTRTAPVPVSARQSAQERDKEGRAERKAPRAAGGGPKAATRLSAQAPADSLLTMPLRALGRGKGPASPKAADKPGRSRPPSPQTASSGVGVIEDVSDEDITRLEPGS